MDRPRLFHVVRGRVLTGNPDPPLLYTVGHSNGSLDDLLARLEPAGVRRLVDVRRFPASRRWPQFNRDSLASALPERGIAYAWIEALGGRRPAAPGSTNAAWQNESFRGYADYMGTAAFQDAFDALLDDAAGAPTAVMCSELLWWRCHRSLLADAAVARGWRVVHLLVGKSETHRLRDFAHVGPGGAVTYPGPATLEELAEEGVSRD